MNLQSGKLRHTVGLAFPYALLVSTMLLWAGNFVVGRKVRNDVPPIALAFWRWAIASVVLLPLAWSDLRMTWRDILPHWRLLFGLSITGVAAYNSLLYTGLRRTTAINASLFLSLAPILIALASVFFGQRAGIRQWAGTVVSFAGALIIVSRGSMTNMQSMSFNAGDVEVLAAIPVWATYTILLTRRPKFLNPLLTQSLITVIGVVLLAPFYAWEWSTGRRVVASVASFQAIAYAGILASVLAYLMWNRAVSDVGALRAGLFLHLIPVFSAVLSSIVLGESVHLYHLAGAILVFAGVGLASRNRAERKTQVVAAHNRNGHAEVSTDVVATPAAQVPL